MRAAVAAFSLSVAIAPLPANAQLLPLTHYTPGSEMRALPSAEVNDVYQDRLGYLWIAIYSSGLVRYDGVRMEAYDERDGLRSLAVWDVIEDAEGRLWVSSSAGLVVSEEPLAAYEGGERVRFVHALGGVPLADVTVQQNVMAVDGRGGVWVGTAALGVLRYEAGREGVVVDTIPTPGADGAIAAVRALAARRDGTVWIGVSGGMLLRYSEDGRMEVVEGRGAPEQHVYTLYETPEGQLWGGERGGRIWRLNETGGTRVFETVSDEPTTTINSIRATGRGRLLIGSGGSGLLAVDLDEPWRQSVYDRRNGLLSDVVHGLLEDHEGNLWIAQTGGLSKLRYNSDAFIAYSARSFIGEQPLLPSSPVGAVWPSSDRHPCHTWAGTSGGGVACLSDADGLPPSTYVQSEDGLSDDYVNALTEDGEGRIWVGTSAGIDALVPAGVEPPPADAVRPVRIGGAPYVVASFDAAGITTAAAVALRVTEAPGPRLPALLFAGYRALFVWVDDEWFRLGSATGLPLTRLHAVAADAAGHIWVGTRDGGLYRSAGPITVERLRASAGANPAMETGRRGREVEGPVFAPVWTTASGAPTDQIEALLWHDGALWTATPSGLFVLEPPSGQAPPRVRAMLDRSSGLGASHVFSLDRSPVTGSIWIGTNAGLAEIDPATHRVRRTVDRRDGLVDNEVWYYGSVRVDERGRVLFGTANGLSVYDPSLDRANRVPPRLHLRAVSLSENAAGHNEIVLEYAATSFANEGAVTYRTRLAGYDPDWSEPTTDAKIRYTNLPAVFFPKRYEFQVEASNGDAATQAPLSYSFVVQPPWWLRWWAFLFYVLVIGTAASLLVRQQRARLVRRMQQHARLREAELRADQAAAERAAAEARSQALLAENELKEIELTKARELEQAYAELKGTQARLVQQEKLASLGQLTAGIAHEIKNPLNFVVNFAKAAGELLYELRAELGAHPPAAGGPNSSVHVAETLDDIASMTSKVVKHGERADRIVKSMLLHARGGTSTFEGVNFNRFVDEFAALSYHAASVSPGWSEITFLREFDPDAGTVELLPQELSRVLTNLFSNAFYAVRERSDRSEEPYDPRVVVRTRRRGDAVEVRIEDNGPGIPDAVRDRIFEPFFTTKPPGEGTGLGLSLTHDIVVQMHGGHIEVESKGGEGTTFIVTLPIRRSTHGRSALEPEPVPEVASPSSSMSPPA
jgi:signal transduction histidine kinase/ligand-binding sensor domain-containing protein